MGSAGKILWRQTSHRLVHPPVELDIADDDLGTFANAGLTQHAGDAKLLEPADRFIERPVISQVREADRTLRSASKDFERSIVMAHNRDHALSRSMDLDGHRGAFLDPPSLSDHGGQPADQLIEATPRNRRDHEIAIPVSHLDVGNQVGARCHPESWSIDEIRLVVLELTQQDRLLLRQASTVRFCEVEEDHEDPSPLDMPQELMAKAGLSEFEAFVEPLGVYHVIVGRKIATKGP